MFMYADLQALSIHLKAGLSWIFFLLSDPTLRSQAGQSRVGFLVFPAAAGAYAPSFSLANHSGYDHCLW